MLRSTYGTRVCLECVLLPCCVSTLVCIGKHFDEDAATGLVLFNRFLTFLVSIESAAGMIIPILYEVFLEKRSGRSGFWLIIKFCMP